MPDTSAATPVKSRLTTVIAVIGMVVGVVGAVVGVLVYLQNRPSDTDGFRQQVDAVCKTAVSRQPQVFLALTERGEYDRAKFTSFATQLVDASRADLEDLRRLDAPAEQRAQYESVVSAEQRVVDATSRYAASLPGLPASEYARHIPDLPGNAGPVNAAMTEVQAGLVSLSGGRCQPQAK